jgi:transposase
MDGKDLLGTTALRGAGRAGRLPQLDQVDLRRVERRLEKGSIANGYATDMWTLQRVAEVIEAETGVAYHPGHVWRILHQLGWSRQRPTRRAVERDDEAIAAWVKHDWPRVNRRQTQRRLDLGLQPPPLSKGHMGPEGQDPRPPSPVQLEAALDVRCRGFRPRGLECLARVQHAARCL